MKTFKFSGLPSNADVASGVTVLACAWFVAAGGAILSGHHSEATVEAARAVPVAEAGIAVRETIVVEARRLPS